MTFDRRELLKLAGMGGVVFASGLAGAAGKEAKKTKKSDAAGDFFFLQLSDPHWGYAGVSNPEASSTLKRAVSTINAVGAQPDFVVFTGDLTHHTGDAAIRRERMAGFKKIVGWLKVKAVHLLPGEDDAAADGGAAYREAFGPTHYAFDHKGVHFVALDNVSDKTGAVGAAQIDWLAADLKKVGRDARIVVLTHRPLFDLFPAWGWATPDGAKVIDVLLPYRSVTVFYGQIHQEHHHRTEHIAHHAARSLVFPLPSPGSVPKMAPLPWDAAAPFNGLGYREVALAAAGAEARLTEQPPVKS